MNGEIRSQQEIEESEVYQKLTKSTMLKFTTSISKVLFSPVYPHSIVGITGLIAPWIDGVSFSNAFHFAKSRSVYSSVDIRKDGVLIALGNESGSINIFPVKDHGVLLRKFKLKNGSIRSLKFSPFQNELIAGTEKGKLFVIDISGRSSEFVINAHQDCISAIEPFSSGNIWITGSHDGTIKIWNFNHPIEISSLNVDGSISNLKLHGDRVYISVGEDIVVASIEQKLHFVSRWTAHTRPIVGLSFARGNLVTIGGDQLLKVFDPSTLNVKFSQKIHSQILSFDILPDASSIIFSLQAGVVQIKTSKPVIESRKRTFKIPEHFQVFKSKKQNLKEPWNQALRRFEFSKSFDLVFETGNTPLIVGMIDELCNIGGLDRALSGRSNTELKPILEFFIEQMINSNWTHVICRAIISIEKIYKISIREIPFLGNIFDQLNLRVEEELFVQKRAAMLIGEIDLLLE